MPTTNDDSTQTTALGNHKIWNVGAYVLNVLITYAIGAGGALDLPSNAELSRKYQSLVTPIGWAFAIWGIIFTSQAIWVLCQLFTSSKKQQHQDYVNAVGYKYCFVCMAQACWTLAFSTEFIELSCIYMIIILVLLWKIVEAFQDGSTPKTVGSYLLWKFPFTIHCGWITAATAVNSSVVLVSRNAPANIQLAMAYISLMAVVAVAFYMLARSKNDDFVIPMVVCWALFGIYKELAQPDEKLQSTFTESQLLRVKLCTLYANCLTASGISVMVLRRLAQGPNPGKNHQNKSKEKPE